MRGAAATDGSVPVGRRPVQQSRGDLTPNLVFPGKSIRTCDTRTLVTVTRRGQDHSRSLPARTSIEGCCFLFLTNSWSQ